MILKSIFTKDIALTLINKYGHKLIDVQDNRRDPRFKVFIFENTKEFIKDFEMVSKGK